MNCNDEPCGFDITQHRIDNRELYLNGFKSLLKVEVHAHLGGSARKSSVEEWLVENGHSPKSATLKAQQMCIPRVAGAPLESKGYEGFGIVSEAHADRPDRITRMVHEYLVDCWNDGIHYVELRTGGSDIDRLCCVELAIRTSPVPIQTKLIVSIKRDQSVEKAWKTVHNAATLGDVVVAVDFAGAESIQHPFNAVQFVPVIDWAQERGMSFVPHFAECKGEIDLLSLLNCKPVRLGHCIFPNPESWKHIVSEHIPIECCLASNLNTMRRDGELPIKSNLLHQLHDPLAAVDHPLVQWYKDKHPFLLCCDDVGLLQCELSEIYQYAAEAIVASEMKNPDFENILVMKRVGNIAWQLSLNAIDHILAPTKVKNDLRKQLEKHEWSPRELCSL